MLRLVAAQDPGGLDLGSGAPRQFLIEVDNALHGDAIWIGSDCLNVVVSASVSPEPGIAPSATPSHSPVLVHALDHPLHEQPWSSLGKIRAHCTYLRRSDLEIRALARS